MIRLYTSIILFSLALAGCNKKNEEKADANGGHGHAHDAPALAGDADTLSEQALKNLGVVVEEVDSSDYVVSRPVAATIEETPFNERPLSAPFAGRVKSISVALGEYLKPGQAVVEIIRDPIPRPTLGLVEELLKPASDEFHDTIAELRTAKVELAINSRERKRLKDIQGDRKSPLIAKQAMLDLGYEGERLAQTIANIRVKLTLHGFSKAEIDGIESGKNLVLSKNLWLSALKQSGIWTANSEAILKELPKSIRANQWSVATIGELTAEGLVTPELTTFLTKNPDAAARIIEIGGLLQGGNSLEDIKDLVRLGAFAPVIKVKTPLGKDWDVEAIHVKIGQMVERGSTLVTLTNHTQVYLSAFPVGSEISAINAALASKRTFSATTLTPGTGPKLSGLLISKIQGLDDQGTKVLFPVVNTPLNVTTVNGRQFRNWQLRNRMKYVLQVPSKVLEDVIVLPSQAVVDFGSEKVIYVKKGTGFQRRKVVVAHRDDQVAVLGEGSDVFPEEPMVVKGAFALSLALRALGGDSAGADAHAGCDHD